MEDSDSPQQQQQAHISTRVLILSDTHGRNFNDAFSQPTAAFDLVIHCGDLTEESKLEEYKTTLNLLRRIRAPVKVVIAGNHDITLDEATYRKHLAAADVGIADEAAVTEYGKLGEAKQLLDSAKEEGIEFVGEGMHTLNLSNGATVTLYANQWTPRRANEGALGAKEAGWAFQYEASDAYGCFDIPVGQHPNIIVTHGPAHGVLDRIPGQRAGCPELFTSVARLRPQLHCFGHIHGSWGAHLVTWRGDRPTCEKPTHFTEIDNENSTILEKLSGLKSGKFDTEETKQDKRHRLARILAQGYCQLELERPIRLGQQTLFVNAAVEGDEEIPVQPPISAILEFPKTRTL